MLFKLKVAKTDYDSKNLPVNRTQVFFDVIKLQWPKLLVCSGLAIIAGLPLIATGIMRYVVQMNINNAAITGEMSEELGILKYYEYVTILRGVDIILYALVAFLLSAVAQVIKLLAWEENVELGKALSAGIRQNSKQYILLGILFGLFVFACNYVHVTSEVWFWIITAVCLVMLAPVAAYMTVTICVYGVKFTQQVLYSTLTYAKNIFKTWVACVCCGLPIAADALVNYFFNPVIGSIVSVAVNSMIPFIMLGWFLFAYNSLDKAMNVKYYPELVGRGLNIGEPPEEVSSDSWLEY